MHKVSQRKVMIGCYWFSFNSFLFSLFMLFCVFTGCSENESGFHCCWVAGKIVFGPITVESPLPSMKTSRGCQFSLFPSIWLNSRSKGAWLASGSLKLLWWNRNRDMVYLGDSPDNQQIPKRMYFYFFLLNFILCIRFSCFCNICHSYDIAYGVNVYCCWMTMNFFWLHWRKKFFLLQWRKSPGFSKLVG